MNRLLHLLVFLLLLLAAAPAAAADKSTYDLTGPGGAPGALAKGALLPADRWMISRSVSAATMLEGGYFTLGTTQGTSGSSLDDNCGITFGHPYAKTSYPVVHIDGVWGKPEQFFQTNAAAPIVSGDTLLLVFTVAQKYELRFRLYLENNGTKIHLLSELKNTDAAAHSFGLGFILDPALGKAGDGCVKIGTASLMRDTTLSAASLDAGAVTITERSSSAFGLKFGLAFPRATPSTFIAANWNDAPNTDTPAFTPSDVRTLYDAVLKIFWAPVTVPANGLCTQEAVITLNPPSFGIGAFLRWDVPPTQSLENGIAFPKQFTSHVSVDNVSAAAKSNVIVEASFPAEVQSSAPSATVSLPPQSAGYVNIPLAIKELYENKVVDLLVVCKEGGIVIDSLRRPLRICATPVSDTGLTVRFDSLMTGGYPAVRFTFDVVKQSTRQNIFSLDRDNLFFYENGARITDYAFGKDTTGGAGAVDIVFVFDVTGSMSNSIDGVKNNIKEFADSLSARGMNFRLGMVTFLDAVENVYEFTDNVQTFKSLVAAQYAHGGGDMPENSLDALTRASLMPFRETAKKIFIWITDANYHEKNLYTARVKQDVINNLLALDVTVHAIGAAEFQTDWYTPFTQATGGNYYNINGNFRDILLDIGNLRGTNRYLVSYTTQTPKGAKKDLRLTVHYAGLGGTAAVSVTSAQPSAAVSSLACFPNPFNPQTTIRVTIPEGATGTVGLYNILGQEVRTFRLTGMTGTADIVWNAKNETGQDVATGLYFIRLTLYSADRQLLSTEVTKTLFLK